jgi:protein arginine kinase
MSWYNKPGKDDHTVISTRIRLSRNLDKIPFPSRMSAEQSENVLKTVSDAILERNRDFTLYRMDDLSDVEKRALLEEHLISRELLDTRLHRGVLINSDRTVSIMINEEDHIRLQCILPGFDPDEAFSIADKIDTLLGESVTYAFHEKLGYLASCPTNVGTGMRASAMIHLPALTLTGNLNNLLNSVGKLGMTIRGLYGEGTEAQGNLYQISNQRTLGMTEEELLHRFTSIITQLMDKEAEVRQKLRDSNDMVLADRVNRAWGILTNARLLSGKEFMNLYSDVCLGQSMGLLPKGSKHMTGLLVDTQPANLIKRAGSSLSATERDVMRAQIVRNYLKGDDQ